MGTHACTRIQKDGDFIEMHTRWDGFPDEIKANLKGAVASWEALSSYTLEQIKEKGLVLPELEKWAKDVQVWMQDVKANPTAEAYAAMLCNESFNHHHVLPVHTEASADTLDYWGYDNPDVVMTIKGQDDFLYTKKSKINASKVKETPVSEEFFMVRIKDESEANVGADNLQEHTFLDIKVKDMTQDEFRQVVLSLPVFWLELHNLVRQPAFDRENEEVRNQQFAFYKENPLVRSISDYKLQHFYSASKKYDDMRDGVLRSQEKLLDNICSSIPFDFGSNVLASHLYFLSAGKIQPMTRGEELWASKQSADKFLQVGVLNDEQRTNLIVMQDSKLEMSADWLNTYVDSTVERFTRLTNQLNKDFTYGVQPQYVITEGKNVGFNYEKSMLAYFHLLTTVDHDMKPNKKLKM
jgi:hypothetical protein